MLYLKKLSLKLDKMQLQYGDPEYAPIYGAGEIEKPNVMLVFMNPTGRNVASHKQWKGLRAPWIGLKTIWKMFYDLNLMSDQDLLDTITSLKASQWDEELAEGVYKHVQEQSLYITNIAKCTFPDARPVTNEVYKQYLPTLLHEIEITKPKCIITFGNQVSSVVLGKTISVSNYTKSESENIQLSNKINCKIYPCYYPVGQGRRNMPIAKERIRRVLNLAKV